MCFRAAKKIYIASAEHACSEHERDTKYLQPAIHPSCRFDSGIQFQVSASGTANCSDLANRVRSGEVIVYKH